MASYADLDGAFSSLQDTLQQRYSPMLPADVGTRWLGTMGDAATIARDVDAWNALPDPLPNGDPVVADLDAAARALASSKGGEEATLAALDLADAALTRLRSYLAAPA